MLADDFTLLAAQATNGTTATPISVKGWDRIGMTVEWGSSTSAGVVRFEAAYTSDYAGTWQELVTVTHAAADTVIISAVDICHKFVRARITTGVTGGTVNAYLSRMKTGKS